jgi:hypothetical protein
LRIHKATTLSDDSAIYCRAVAGGRKNGATCRRSPPVARQNSYATLLPASSASRRGNIALLNGRRDDEFVFEQLSFQLWLRYAEVQLRYGGARIVNGDLRKFCEQYGDIIQWDQSNRAYIMTHGVSGIDWKHYKHPLPENVYDAYMKY